ncbi:MAG TPA: tRNA (adenosine(37)-N6)-threonylcarbamoyltransferase complex dimerization subunit type 1 TsaB [Terriglobia bacterium]|nr:tRNA (adenosine(37)-N6)-threonylcarbamoyltransferase complex dimerization subunit type 1 TsaB [Terriglobia bacterium]
MLTLAFDTTGEHGGAGLFRDGQCLGAIENTERANYSVFLFEMVERLLAEAGTQISEVELFAVANGPGSFTGIRVGVAAAQGWATAFGRPVCGVSVLAAMAAQARIETEWAASIIDAHRGELYAGLFRRRQAAGDTEPGFEPQGDGWVAQPGALAKFFEERIPLTCVIREQDVVAQAARAFLPSSVQWQIVPGTLVAGIARIALDAHARQRLQSPAELDACYIRRTDAELKLSE